jgi:drug/metabolite transporter (DMT)-like permease
LVLYVQWSDVDFKENIKVEYLKLLLPVGLLDIFAFFSYGFGVRGESASIVAPVAAAFPLITIVLAGTFLREKLSLSQSLGIVGTILGLVLISF